MKRNVILALAVLLALTQAPSRAATLSVGDPAPKLQTGKWVQGEAVKEFQKDKAYIVEFWATWCGPCRVSIPHLNELHEKYKDKGLVVIGQNVWERDEAQVEPFIKKMGDKMTYRVAMDDKSGDSKGKMAETWMQAAGQNGIPAAFLVGKDGKIAWIGHPMELKDTVIEQVLEGKFDLKAAAEEQKKAQAKQEQLMSLSQQLGKHMEAKEYDKAEATLDEIAKVLPPEQAAGIDNFRLRIMLTKGDQDAAAALAEKLSAKIKDEPARQNELAWMLACSEGIGGKALDAAAKIADAANQATDSKQPEILDTVARIAFMKGDKERAIKTQEKAVGLASGEMKDQLQKALTSYKEGKLPDVE